MKLSSQSTLSMLDFAFPESANFRSKISGTVLNMYRLFFLSLFSEQHNITIICTVFALH
jgi:hypothetical protein